MFKRAEGMGMRAIRRAMTLMECLVAMAVLVVAASIMGMSVQGGLAAQEEALLMALAGTAAESRVAEFLATSYNTLTPSDETEGVGEMQTPSGVVFCVSYDGMGRHTIVSSAALTVPDFPGLVIPGFLIEVDVADTWNGHPRPLATLKRFRPRTIEEVGQASP